MIQAQVPHFEMLCWSFDRNKLNLIWVWNVYLLNPLTIIHSCGTSMVIHCYGPGRNCTKLAFPWITKLTNCNNHSEDAIVPIHNSSIICIFCKGWSIDWKPFHAFAFSCSLLANIHQTQYNPFYQMVLPIKHSSSKMGWTVSALKKYNRHKRHRQWKGC